MRRDSREGGEGAGERESERERQGGCAAERATWDRETPPAPASAPPGPLHPSGPSPPSQGPRTRHPRGRMSPPTPKPIPSWPPPQSGPSLRGDAPSPTSRSRHCFCRRLAGTRLRLGARPLAWSPQSQPRRVGSPRFSHARGIPHLASGGPFFTEFRLFFSGGRRLPPAGSGGQSFRPPSRASPPARSGWPPRN